MPESMAGRAIRGVILKEERFPPLELPAQSNLYYFRLLRGESARSWQQIQSEKSAVVRWTGNESADYDLTLVYDAPEIGQLVPMTPLELCEPIFTRICVLNRLGRNQGGSLTYDQLRLEIEQLFAGVRNSAEADPALRVQWQKLELPMIFFVDSMISESGLAVASTWNRSPTCLRPKRAGGR